MRLQTSFPLHKLGYFALLKATIHAGPFCFVEQIFVPAKGCAVSSYGVPMFIKKQQRPWVEFSPEDGQDAPALVHYFSDRSDPFKTVLPQLAEGAGKEEEHVFVVESPLSEILDETVGLYREPEWPDRVVVDKRHRAFFEAVKLSLAEAMAKIDQIEFFAVAEDDDVST